MTCAIESPRADVESPLLFPGVRNAKHYFPVTRRATSVAPSVAGASGVRGRYYAVGIDEVLVDVEVAGPIELARDLGLVPGESVQLDDAARATILARLEAEGLESYSCAPGGTVANTLTNYTFLSGEPSVLLGAIQATIRPGDPAFTYLCQTPKAVDLGQLLPVEGVTGTAITFVSPDGERSFGVAPGVAGHYPAEAIDEDTVRGASVVLGSLYSLRPRTRPIADAALRMMALAHEAGVPVAFGLGTAHLVAEMRDELRRLLADYVTIAAMNAREAEALTGESDVLLATRAVLEWVDVVIITEGHRGLTLGGWCDEPHLRHTRHEVRSKSIPNYNEWEFSRLARRDACNTPVPVFSHIHPYRGGPEQLANTNGAGDAALAALLHDIAANRYHRTQVPGSSKHDPDAPFLTYSSVSRNAQYANRVAYEVLTQRSPRLDGPVPADELD